jgi:hypothetical protein
MNRHPAIESCLGPSYELFVLHFEAQLRPAILITLHVEIQIAELSIEHVLANLDPFR